MKSLWDQASRRELVGRLERLRPDRRAEWGRMSAPQMVAHLTDSMRMTVGELTIAPKPSPIRYAPLKQLIIYWLPFPKGVPTAPELLARPAGEWTADVAELRTLIDRFEERAPQGAWPEHPAFGRLTPRAWGVLGYRHVDHHLRQFGV